MLHIVKKQVARVQQPLSKNAPNAEFADLKQRLTSIKNALKYTSAMLTDSNRTWVKLMQQQRLFSERFQEAYPSTRDDTYAVATDFAIGSQNLYDKFTREASDDVAVYHHIHRQVLLYIKEIETVEAVYSKLAQAKSEACRYQAKLDSMERSRRPMDESKKTRNLQKMDNEKDVYKKLLRDTVDQQKVTYSKYPIVFKAALTSYWLNHEKHVSLLVQSLEKTQEFAKKNEKEMKELDITAYVRAGSEEPSFSSHLDFDLARQVPIEGNSSSTSSKGSTKAFASPLSTPRKMELDDSSSMANPVHSDALINEQQDSSPKRIQEGVLDKQNTALGKTDEIRSSKRNVFAGMSSGDRSVTTTRDV